jgi:hypothetical protein
MRSRQTASIACAQPTFAMAAACRRHLFARSSASRGSVIKIDRHSWEDTMKAALLLVATIVVSPPLEYWFFQ